MNLALIDVSKAGAALARCTKHRNESLPQGVSAAKEVSPASLPWWLWPHLLSLDAPLVAMLWQCWFAHVAGVTLPASRGIILGLGVWLIYLADRLADAADNDRSGSAPRHVFSGDRRWFLQPFALSIALFMMVIAPRWLPGVEFRAGLGLLALALGYFWLIHGRTGRGWAAYLPKEAVVGGMFGAGSVFFVICQAPHLSGTAGLGAGLFAAVCFLNCAFITKWERHARDLRERSSLLNSFPRLSAHLRTACAILAIIALIFSAATTSLFAVPVAASALLLAVLDCCQTRMSSDALRVFADMVLFTPLLGLI